MGVVACLPSHQFAAGSDLLQPGRALAVPRGRSPHRVRVRASDLGVDGGDPQLSPSSAIRSTLQDHGFPSLGHPLVHAGGSLKGSSAASRKVGLLVAALACAIRPTSAITWLCIGLLDLIGLQSRIVFLLFEGFGGCGCTFI